MRKFLLLSFSFIFVFSLSRGQGRMISGKVITQDDGSNLVDPASASFGSADLLYAGNVASWKLFANSQKLKMAMTLADVNAAKSKTETEAASSAGVFTSNDKNVKPSGATRLLPKFSAV